MGHGNHWEAIIPDIAATLSDLLPTVVRKGTLAGESAFDQPLPSGGTRPEKAFALTYPDTPLRFLTLVATDTSRPEPANVVDSAYPYCAEGLTNRILIDEVKPWLGPIEGILSGTSRGGATVTFFDPDFYKNRHRYHPGKAYDFSVAALAYTLAKATQDTITVTGGPVLERERQRLLEINPHADVSHVNSVELSIAGLRCLLPCRAAQDDAEFRTIAEEVGYFEAEGYGFYRIRATLMVPDDVPFAAYIYASETILKGYRPQKGDAIQGILWLQGRLASEQEFDADPSP